MAAVTTRAPIVDPYGRRIHYVRLSVTDRCNFRCLYCMPEEGVPVIPHAEMLTFEETGRLARILAEMGVDRIRLTGGEPTVRRDIAGLVARIALAREAGLADLSMTTNGYCLARLAEPLRQAGLDRLNVSLDTLRPERFERLTRRPASFLVDVLSGIEATIGMGWLPLKLNVVVCGGLNDDEAPDFVRRFASVPVTIRFIEYMPFSQHRFAFVPWEQTRERLLRHFRLVPACDVGSGPAECWLAEGTQVRVGTIRALSHGFCERCNRVRITSDGRLKCCLAFEKETVSLRDVMRAGGSDADVERAIRKAVLAKPGSHECTQEGGRPFDGSMVRIGG